MARAVRFTEYGGRDVLHVEPIDIPTPGAGEIVVEVRAAGTNPGEAAIRQGFFDGDNPQLPSGQGSDFAGVVQSTGDGVTNVATGDEVLGWSWTRSSQASHVLVPANQVIEKPASLPWEVAGSLYVVGVTAYAAVRAVAPSEGETVAVSAAAGGVGSVVVQLLRHRGSNVLGIASASNAEWLTAHGVTPIAYGDGLEDRLRAAAPDGVDAFIDLFGPDYLDLAVALGVPVDRIETIISFARAQELGTKAEGSGDATTPEILAEVAALVADGTIEIPIAATYPLDEVQDAFSQLEDRHTHGKIVLIP
ncbi:MAG: NADPH:quinone reductase [Frondihabitans sp.]|nr:NADPH:quinone reductase [Frondihabitans sp.]